MSKIDTFWTTSNNAIKEFFDTFKIEAGYIDFHFKYNWSNYKEIEDYLMRLMYSSHANNKNIRPFLKELIHDVEEFFATGIKNDLFNKNNIETILKRLKDENEGMRIIEPLKEQGLYGKSVQNKVQINLNMPRHPNSPKLTEKEIRKLYMFHEMGHKIINISKNIEEIDNYTKTLENILRTKGINNPDITYSDTIYNGLLMIEECLVQELAEILTYSSSKKQRPNYRKQHEIASIHGNDIEDCIVSTNLDFYGIFQTPTINLGKTLRGCYTRNSTDTEVLLNMIKKAINTNFTEELFREYNNGDGKLYQDLFITLRAMGFIQIQKYATFGQGTPIKGIKVNNCLNAISNITSRNQDIRQYPKEGFPKIEYEKYKQNSTTIKK